VSARFQYFCSAPIVVDSRPTGAVTIFFRDVKHLGDAPGEQLRLWCNIATLALERRRLYDELSHRATYDGLTGLPNRGLLYERLAAEISHASKGGGLVGLIYVDDDKNSDTILNIHIVNRLSATSMESGSFADSDWTPKRPKKCKADDPHCVANHITTEP
jgi:predicted signal transduction protein with EAL and GGDEF domain